MTWNDDRLGRERKRRRFCGVMVRVEEGARARSLAREALIFILR
jgi:hypothetical protein